MKVLSFIKSIFSKPEAVIEAKVAPVIEDFIKLFASDTGKLILSESMTAVVALATGTPFSTLAGSLMADLIAKEPKILAQDAALTLAQVQSALQISKAVQGIKTPSDAQTLATIGN